MASSSGAISVWAGRSQGRNLPGRPFSHGRRARIHGRNSRSAYPRVRCNDGPRSLASYASDQRAFQPHDVQGTGREAVRVDCGRRPRFRSANASAGRLAGGVPAAVAVLNSPKSAKQRTWPLRRSPGCCRGEACLARSSVERNSTKWKRISLLLPRRKGIRIPGYDYSWSGADFVTICSQDRHYLFGKPERPAVGAQRSRRHRPRLLAGNPHAFPACHDRRVRIDARPYPRDITVRPGRSSGVMGFAGVACRAPATETGGARGGGRELQSRGK